MVPQAGQRIGPYEILGRLGSGGMGLVFSAWDGRLQRDVAIKLLRDEYCTPEMRSRFLQEARAASGLNHPNICTIFDIGEQKGDPYLVMELLKGETLRTRISEGRLSLADMVCVATEVADALTVAHAKGVIHRDIKPANIILVEKPGGGFGTKVLDFGLAKMEVGVGGGGGGTAVKEVGMDLTSIGSTVGTVSYMSPEQARGELLDARSDLFSLGVVMYEMTTGQVPFSGATSALVFVQLLSHPPEAVRQLNEDMPRELERVINRLLEKDRSRRFQSAAALVEALRRVPTQVAASKQPWWSFGSVTPSRPRAAVAATPRVEAGSSQDVKRVTLEDERAPVQPARVGESVLRPVRRIVSSDSSLRPATAGVRAASSAPAVQGAGRFGDGAGLAEITDPLPAGARSSGSANSAAAMVAGAGSGAAAAAEIVARNGSGEAAAVEAGAVESGAVDLSAEAESSGGSVRIPRPLPEMRWHYSLAMQQEDEQQKPAGGVGWIWGVAIAAAVVVAAVAGWYLWPRHTATVSATPRTLVLGSLSNSTGDNGLPAAIVEGLELDLEQSRLLNVEDPAELLASLQAQGAAPGGQAALGDQQRAAQAIGAGVMVLGEVTKFNSAYVLTLRVYDVASGNRMAEVSETAPTREQIPGAIDRVALGVRSALGESGDSMAQTSLPMEKQATSNLDALNEYATGLQMVESGQLLAAMHALESATTADSKFAQGYLAQAALYREQHAGSAAAEAATQAVKAAQGTGSRTQALAEASYDLNAQGDVAGAMAAAQKILASQPADGEAAAIQAGGLLDEGKFAEALAGSQAILKSDPYDLEASRIAETALLAEDQPDAAAAVETVLQRSGRSHPGLRVWTNYLGSRVENPLAADAGGQLGRLGLEEDEAAALDGAGLLESGLRIWRTVAAQASANPELMSAAAGALASAALDRGLAGDCAGAKDLLSDAAGYPQRAGAVFASGMTEGLCGNVEAASNAGALLERTYPHSFAVENYYRPELAAVVLWKHGKAAAAASAMEAAKAYDLISLTAYLRGVMELEAKQPQAAIADFEVVLGHRGAATLANPMLVPMAELGQARAYAASGDPQGSVAAYRKLEAMWATADGNLEAAREAHARAGSGGSEP